MIDDKGLDDEFEKIFTMPLHLGGSVLSNSKRIMNNFIHACNGFYTNGVHYIDTDSLYIENKHWNKLHEAGLVGKQLFQGEDEFKEEGHLVWSFLARKIKYCLTIKKYGVIDEHKTFKGFTNVFEKIDRKEFPKMFD